MPILKPRFAPFPGAVAAPRADPGGRVRKALKLDGVTGYTSIANGNEIGLMPVDETDFFILTLIKPASVGYVGLVTKYTGGAGKAGYDLGIAATGKVVWVIRGGGSSDQLDGTRVLNLNSWNTILTVYNPAYQAIYIDGRFDISKDPAIVMTASTEVFNVGARANASIFRGGVGRTLFANLGHAGLNTLKTAHAFSTIADLCTDLSRRFYLDPYFRKFADIGYGELDMNVPFYKQVILNNSFETWSGGPETPDNWTKEGNPTTYEKDAVTVYDGTYSCHIVGDTGDGVTQTITCRVGKTYRISVWVYITSIAGAKIGVWFVDSAWRTIALTDTTGSWINLTGTVTPDKESCQLKILAQAGVTACDFNIDFVKVYIDESEQAYNGDCETTNVPGIAQAGGHTRATGERSSEQYHNGTYSWKVTADYAGTNSFRWDCSAPVNHIFNDHMLEISAWVYLPSGQTISSITLSAYDEGWTERGKVTTTTTDTWVQLKITAWIPKVNLGRWKIFIGTDSADLTSNPYFYFDELRVHEVGSVADWRWDHPLGIWNDHTVNENHLTPQGSGRDLANFVYPRSDSQSAIWPGAPWRNDIGCL